MANHIGLTRCTAQHSDGSFCDAPSAPDMPYPICSKHAIKVYLRVAEMKDDVMASIPKSTEAIGRAFGFSLSDLTEDPGFIYYVRVGSFIKIGYTNNLRRRLATYGPIATPLGWERGDQMLESRRHMQFKHLLAAGNEWFSNDREILDHIAALEHAA